MMPPWITPNPNPNLNPNPNPKKLSQTYINIFGDHELKSQKKNFDHQTLPLVTTVTMTFHLLDLKKFSLKVCH